MKVPNLEEMGDIGPAVENLLRLQADYARREPGVSRAMRDVAYKAVAFEIERYITMRFDTQAKLSAARSLSSMGVGEGGPPTTFQGS